MEPDRDNHNKCNSERWDHGKCVDFVTRQRQFILIEYLPNEVAVCAPKAQKTVLF